MDRWLDRFVMLIFIGIAYLIIRYLYEQFTYLRLPWARRFKDMLTFEKIKKLEALRREFSVSYEAFEVLVLSSAALGTKIIERDYARLKKLYPDRDERRILRDLLIDDFSRDPDFRGKDYERMADEAMVNISAIYHLTHFIECGVKAKNSNFYESTLGIGIENIIRE